MIDFGTSNSSVLEGDLIASSVPQLSGLHLSSITNITGNWTLFNLSSLTSISSGVLHSCAKVYFSTLLAVSQIETSEVIEVTDVTVFNTSFTSLPLFGGNDFSSNVSITNNNKLGDVAFDFQLLDTLIFESNGNSSSLDLSSLSYAETLRITNSTSFTAQNLQAVELLVLEGNELTSFEAPGLSECGSFLFSNNPNITSLKLNYFPTNLSIVNNNALQQVEFGGPGNVVFGKEHTVALSGKFLR